MEKQKRNQKRKSNVIKLVFTFAVLITIVIFFSMKIVNALVNNRDVLEVFKTISLIPPTNLTTPNIIDYISDIILLVVLPVLVLVWIIVIIKFKTKKTKNENIELPNAKKHFTTSLKTQKDETKMILEVESSDIDEYPLFEEDKTFFEEINNESDNDLTFLQKRAKADGSVLIQESLSELVKNAYKIRKYAILKNIEVDDVVLEEMTKKELILFMKKVGDKLKENKYQSFYFSNSSKNEAIKISEYDNLADINDKKQSENFNIDEVSKVKQKESVIKKSKVTKKDLINSIFINNDIKLTKAKIKIIVDSLFELMENNLIEEGSEIKINNFAKFSTVSVKQTTMKDIRSGELKIVPSCKAIKFKSLNGLKESLNNEKV
ncbi:hypothetical protein CG007_02490 [Mesoplasma entomophilum]|uniref:HU family DNA-binding protein n=1 Tax=Mesoplasma entomophilum TaxID=2149 RepID=UPI000D029061|nr:HU family DNA-binding protein [Mesoplasma entomophilum]AVN60469.1 hypothetical protein CG007_02490 [Mesoplasma entomophilum]